MNQNEKFPNKSSLLAFFLKGSYHFFIWASIFALLMNIISMISPRIISYTVDSLIGNTQSSLPPQIDNLIAYIGGKEYLRNHLYIIAIVTIVVALLGAIFRYLFRVVNTKGAEMLVKRMRDSLFDKLLHLPYDWFSLNHTGDIIQRCTSDVDTIKEFLSNQLVSLIRLLILLIMAIISMLSIHSRLTLAICLYIPFIFLYSFIFHHRIGDAFERADNEHAKLSSIAQENLEGVRVVRAFGRESYEKERFERQDDIYTKYWFRLMKILSAFWSFGDLFSGLQLGTAVILGAVYATNGELSAGNYIAFLSYTSMMQWPVRSLGRIISEMSKASVSIERLRYIMNSQEEIDDINAITPNMDEDIIFKHVSYAYDNVDTEVIEDISFKIKAGTTFGILGGTGSGKSTLMALLVRLYELKDGEGTISIGNIDIKDIRLSYLRQNIGMVLQEPFLFSRTLKDNISIARPSSNMQDIEEAVRIASLDETVNRFDKGYETYVGEKGVTLSGGQKQRTAIAQMLIRKPPIMIFDDSLSAVDAETDAKIRSALQDNTSKSTKIIIAHRITTLMNADYIIVLEHGHIKEEGTHQDLLAKNGIYKKIYDLQSAEF